MYHCQTPAKRMHCFMSVSCKSQVRIRCQPRRAAFQFGSALCSILEKYIWCSRSIIEITFIHQNSIFKHECTLMWILFCLYFYLNISSGPSQFKMSHFYRKQFEIHDVCVFSVPSYLKTWLAPRYSKYGAVTLSRSLLFLLCSEKRTLTPHSVKQNDEAAVESREFITVAYLDVFITQICCNFFPLSFFLFPPSNAHFPSAFEVHSDKQQNVSRHI